MRPTVTTLTVLLVFFVVHYGKNLLYQLVGVDTSASWTFWPYTAHVLLWYVLLPLLALIGLYGWPKGWQLLGWQADIRQGFIAAFMITVPMLFGFALFFKPVDFTRHTVWIDVYMGALWAGLSEETFYRAFFFGQLYYYGRWPFVIAALAQALLFGAGHLYQAHQPGQAVGIFAVTALGALWFAWLWLAWRNLWVPIFVHVFMNAWWILFTVAPTALGGWVSNGLRALTIILSILLTLRELRRQGRSYLVWQDIAPAN